MLMKIRPELEPLLRLRAFIPQECGGTFSTLMGAVDAPPDQPGCATAVATLCDCLLIYADGIEHPRPHFTALLEDIKKIRQVAVDHAEEIQGAPVSGALDNWILAFPVWALLISLAKEAIPLRVALGAEIAGALLTQERLSKKYCEQLRRAAKQYGRPQDGNERLPQDLADRGFGRGWFPHFQRVDRQVRRQVELPDPGGPSRPAGTQPRHSLDIIARLRWRFEYPDPKHRQAATDDSHLPLAQLQRATAAVRARVVAGKPSAVVEAICILTRLTPDLVQSLPLIKPNRKFRFIGIDPLRGWIVLDLNALFPDRNRPPAKVAHLFHTGGDLLVIPLAAFLAEAIRQKASERPGAPHLLAICSVGTGFPATPRLSRASCASSCRHSHGPASPWGRRRYRAA